jgi:hypothetical protein
VPGAAKLDGETNHHLSKSSLLDNIRTFFKDNPVED